jgi:hypothetical protein
MRLQTISPSQLACSDNPSVEEVGALFIYLFLLSGWGGILSCPFFSVDIQMGEAYYWAWV